MGPFGAFRPVVRYQEFAQYPRFASAGIRKRRDSKMFPF